jgi:UDP-N-acetylglucosamine acyltransferase
MTANKGLEMFFIKKNYSVSKKAHIDNNVTIGEYCVVEDDVTIESGSILKNNVFIGSNTYIGKNNIIFPFAVIGSTSQDKKYSGEPTFLKIGNDNVFREYVSVNRSTKVNDETKVGNNNYFLTYSHVGHDCIIKDNVTVGSHAALGGYSLVSRKILGSFVEKCVSTQGFNNVAEHPQMLQFG